MIWPSCSTRYFADNAWMAKLISMISAGWPSPAARLTSLPSARTYSHLPSGISYIGENAFWHCAPQLGAVVDAGTFAENWCKASGVPYATPFRWTVKGETVELVQYAGDETAVTVPAQVQGKPVVSLGGNCFQGNTAVQEVVLPEGLKTIGANAFARCARLASVRLPSTLAKIDYAAFAGCIRLKEITIPGGVHRLMNNILENCRSLQKIVLCSGIQYIGSKSFFGCTSLTEAVLPETLTKIGMMAFGHCEALQEIRLPEGLKELEPSAFADCRSLKHAELPKSLGIIGSEAFGGCGEALVCTVQPGSAAEKWCRTQRIRTGSARLSAAGGKAQQDRFCTRCGMPLSKLTGKCRNCDR